MWGGSVRRCDGGGGRELDARELSTGGVDIRASSYGLSPGQVQQVFTQRGVGTKCHPFTCRKTKSTYSRGVGDGERYGQCL